MASFKELMASTYIAKLIFDKCRRIPNRKLISHTIKELFGWAAQSRLAVTSNFNELLLKTMVIKIKSKQEATFSKKKIVIFAID